MIRAAGSVRISYNTNDATPDEESTPKFMHGLLVAAAFTIFTVLSLLAFRISRTALLRLSDEEKARLVDAAAQTSSLWFVALVVMLLTFAGASRVVDHDVTDLIAGFFVGLFALMALANVVSYRRLERAGMPAHFNRSFALSRGLRMTGAALALASIASYLADLIARAS